MIAGKLKGIGVKLSNLFNPPLGGTKYILDCNLLVVEFLELPVLVINICLKGLQSGSSCTTLTEYPTSEVGLPL